MPLATRKGWDSIVEKGHELFRPSRPYKSSVHEQKAGQKGILKMTKKDFITLLEKEGNTIFSYCLYLCRNDLIAEDLFQEACLYAYERLAILEKDHNPKAYILTLVNHLWEKTWRKERRRKKILGFSSLDAASEEGQEGCYSMQGEAVPLPDELYLRKEQQKRVLRAVMQLDDLHRIPVLLYYTAGLSYQEIAYRLKIPVGTVKSRIHHAKEQLKITLSQEDFANY